MALLSLIDNINTSLDAHKHAFGVFMDIKKASNTIDHNILLKNEPLSPQGHCKQMDLWLFRK